MQNLARTVIARRVSTRLALGITGLLLLPALAPGEPVPVRHAEGLVHGFLTLRTLAGELLANGDLMQNARGARVTSRLTFRFKDGSVQDETAVFSQRHEFRLISDHVVQKGPSFPKPIDMRIDTARGDVTVRYEENGASKVSSDHFNLPTDLANGMLLSMLKNMRPDAPPTTVGFVAAAPKPTLVKLAIANAGDESFSTGSVTRKATHYVLKVEIGGIKGMVAPLVGRQPPDSHVWILGGDAPAFVKAEQPFYEGGPVWRIELVSPNWPKH